MFCSHCGAANVDGARFCASCGSALQLASSGVTAPSRATTTSAVTTRHYAGFWRRFAALFIDGLIVAGCSVGVAVVFGVLAMIGSSEFTTGAVVGYYLASFVIQWLYFALSEASPHQATIGKRALEIYVADAAGQRISFGRATGRVFAKWLNALTLGIGWLMAAFTSEKRALHDYVAGTIVLARDDARKMHGAVIAVLAVVAFIPVVGIIAAIAIPGLLRARMSGNEASAIGSMRVIQTAQQGYSSRCGGYAPDLVELTAAGGAALGDLVGGSFVKSGYTFTIEPSQSAVAVPNPPPGCTGTVSDYVALASPNTRGSTGVRYFSVDRRGTIFQDSNGTFTNPTPLE
jgi:uncharacterized RDD family membrane protein YckC/type II secretory pathway pseudopilin PulG